MELLASGPLAAIITIFCLGYAAIIFEYLIRVNKTAVALLISVLCWVVYFYASTKSIPEDYEILGGYVSEVSQIIFFLLGAMTLVELIDSHKGFKIITDVIRTESRRKMLWLITIITFFLSAVLDNLTTTILMVSLLKKLIRKKDERFLLSCMVVVAANAGGAWTPMGDVTTTMLWIKGQVSTISVIRALVAPSIISVIFPLLYFTWKVGGTFTSETEKKEEEQEPGARLVLVLGIGALMFVPLFKYLTGMPPFMGVTIGLAVLWLVTDLLHHQHEPRAHLRVPHVLTKIDTSGIMFFLGILLAVNALEASGVLGSVAVWLENTVANKAMIATLIGVFSAIIDNVPLVAATMGMYPISEFPMDDKLWHMIAYAAGTGGSMLVIGSSSGIALMGLEKVDFFKYMRWMTWPVLIGYLIGMGSYLVLYDLFKIA